MNDSVNMLNARSTVIARPLDGKNIKVTAAVKQEQEVQLNYLTKPLRKDEMVIPPITPRLLDRLDMEVSPVAVTAVSVSTTLFVPPRRTRSHACAPPTFGECRDLDHCLKHPC